MDREKVPYVSVQDVEHGHEHRHAPVRVFSKMSRVLVSRVFTRKALVACFAAFVLLFLYNHGSDEFNVNGRPCAHTYNRTNPHRIVPPRAQDQAFLSDLWSGMKRTFDTHGPQPAHIDHPKHPEGGAPPKDKKIGSDFNMSDEQAAITREHHKAVVASLPAYPTKRFRGRGVVVLAGAKYSEFAATSLGVLREVGSKLPVEVWTKNATEEIPGWCPELEREGMVCRRLSDYMDMSALKHPYQWKVFTLLFSTFEEILFLDADSMPIKNPDFVFDSEPYVSKGAVLWPDYWKSSASPYATYIAGITDQPDDQFQQNQSVESGQLFWNKAMHWKSLCLASYYNYWGPDHFYTVFNNGYAGWGDKDTFPFALHAMKEDYYMVPHTIVTAFVNGSSLGIGMVQADPTVEETHVPMFMHSNIVKWSVRRFFCEQCERFPSHEVGVSHLVNTDSPIHDHLRSGQRIFSLNQFAPKHIDPEPLMWKAFEFTACRSSWAIEGLCTKTRNFMTSAFGTQFVPMGPNDHMGRYNQVCLANPEVLG